MSLRWVGEAITGTTAFGFGRIRVSRRGSGAHFGPAGKTLTLVGKKHAVDRPSEARPRATRATRGLRERGICTAGIDAHLILYCLYKRTKHTRL